MISIRENFWSKKNNSKNRSVKENKKKKDKKTEKDVFLKTKNMKQADGIFGKIMKICSTYIFGKIWWFIKEKQAIK